MSKVAAVVFTKDRPMQAEAALRSLLSQCEDPERLDVKVLYLATSRAMHERYARVAASLPGVELVPEAGFQQTLLAAVGGASHVLFVVDDALFVRTFSAGRIVELLERIPSALGFSLRLGRNTTYCYPLDRTQRLPGFEAEGDALSFDWTRADLDFAYPLEVSSSVYRMADLAPLLTDLRYRNPNELEAVLAAAKDRVVHRPRLLCAPESIAFCAPVNLVQSSHPNRGGARAAYSPGRLAALFDAGVRIDVASLRGLVPRGCHEEIELPFTGGAIPPRVSVVVPCGSRFALLPFAVASLVAQSFEDWEAVVVCRPGADAEGAARLFSRHPGRALRIAESAGGHAEECNRGILAARGELISVLDPGDAMAPMFLARAVAALDANPRAAIAFTGTRPIGPDAGERSAGPADLARLRAPERSASACVFRREVFEGVGGFDPGVDPRCAAWDFLLGAADLGMRGVGEDEALRLWRESEDDASDAVVPGTAAWARVVERHPRSVSAADRERARRVVGSAPLPGDGTPAGAAAAEPGAPAVSVVVHGHLEPEWLAFAVSSVAMQTFKDWELVIVDDGEREDAGAVAGALCALVPDRPVRRVRVERRGPGAARNAGVRAARGRFVVALDAADALDPRFLERAVALLESDPGAAIVATDGVALGEQQALLCARPPATLDDVRRENGLLPCAAYRREVFEAVGGYDPELLALEDWDFWIGAKEKGFAFAHVSEPLLFCRVRPAGLPTGAAGLSVRCRVVLNHPGTFSAGERAAAEAFLAAHPAPSPLPVEAPAPVAPRPGPGRLALPDDPRDPAAARQVERVPGRFLVGGPAAPPPRLG